MKALKAIGRFFVPEDIEIRKRRLELMVWAFLLALSFYPGWWGVLAWFSLVRPLIIISRLDRASAFKAAYFFGFFFNLFSLYWVAMVTPPGTLAAIVIVAAYYAVVLYLFNVVYSWRPLLGYIALPFLWVGMEYMRTLSQFAFPWSDLGYSQAYFLYVLQIVSVIGVHGLSLLILGVNVLLVQALRSNLSPERRLTSMFVSGAVVALLVSFGWIVTPPIPMPGSFDVALLQGSVPLDVKWSREFRYRNLILYDSLIQTASDSNIQLYIWPETSAPCYLTHDAVCRARIGDIARESGRPQLVGALGAVEMNGIQHLYNSAYQFSPDGRIEERYDKVKLVPFSEQVPYQDELPFLKKEFLTKYLTFIETYDVQWWSDFYPGEGIKLFDVDDVRYGVLICFECTFPEYTRKMVLRGADFLAGITNDTWFGNSVGIYMHARIFITRAVENRIWMVRAANSGITFIVDKYGRVRKRLGYNEVGTLEGKVELLDGYSVFTEYGDVAGRASFLILVSIGGILIIIWISRKIIRR